MKPEFHCLVIHSTATHFNFYDHYEDNNKKRPRDTTPVYFPSKMYLFWAIKEDIGCDLQDDGQYDGNTEAQTCAIRVHWPDVAVTKQLLSVCRKISERQQLTDLCLKDLYCEDLTEKEAPVINENARTVFLANHLQRPSPWPKEFLKNILQQLA